MSLHGDVLVKYINATGKADFEVVVFTEPTDNIYVAWQVLQAQTSAEFIYPVALDVHASYYQPNGTKIDAGPLAAKLKSTWEITQETKASTAILKEDAGVVTPDSTIIIKNIDPRSWTGRKFDVGIYKNNQPFAVHPNLEVGSQVEFTLQNKVYFGVVQNMSIGEIFQSLNQITAPTEFDLTHYPNGITVTLSESQDGGKYLFSGKPSKYFKP